MYPPVPLQLSTAVFMCTRHNLTRALAGAVLITAEPGTMFNISLWLSVTSPLAQICCWLSVADKQNRVCCSHCPLLCTEHNGSIQFMFYVLLSGSIEPWSWPLVPMFVWPHPQCHDAALLDTVSISSCLCPASWHHTPWHQTLQRPERRDRDFQSNKKI